MGVADNVTTSNYLPLSKIERAYDVCVDVEKT